MHSPRAEGVDEPEPQPDGEGQNGSAAAGPLALHRNGNGWVVPQAAIDHAVAVTHDVESLRVLHAGVAAVETVAHEVHVPFEQLHDLAISKMEIERKIGHLLSQTVRPGRHAQMCPRGTFDEEESDGTLPSGINRKQSARYQQLAAVPEADLADYFAQSKRKQQVPSTTGLLRLTRKGSPQKKQPPKRRAAGARSAKPFSMPSSA